MSEPISSQEAAKVENPVFVFLFRLLVPILLGAILTIALSINSAQQEQGRQISVVQGQLVGIAQQNSDFVNRLNKVEQSVDDNRKVIGILTGRVLVLEAHPAR